MNKKITVSSALDLLKTGGDLNQCIITDLAVSRVNMLEALLLAEHGYVVPDGNIIYDDDLIQPDSEFEQVAWGRPVSFKQFKQGLKTEKQASEREELVLKLQIDNADMKRWLANNGEQINLVVRGLLESMYKADKLVKSEEKPPKRQRSANR